MFKTHTNLVIQNPNILHRTRVNFEALSLKIVIRNVILMRANKIYFSASQWELFVLPLEGRMTEMTSPKDDRSQGTNTYIFSLNPQVLSRKLWGNRSVRNPISLSTVMPSGEVSEPRLKSRFVRRKAHLHHHRPENHEGHHSLGTDCTPGTSQNVPFNVRETQTAKRALTSETQRT